MRLSVVKKTLKNVPYLGNTLSMAYKALLRWQEKKYLKPNTVLKNIFANKSIYILATGPSIKNQNLTTLRAESCISVSNFFVHPDFAVIRPEYHVFAASHHPITESQITAWFQDAEKYFPDDQKIIMSITDRHIIEKCDIFKKQTIYYYALGRNPLATDGEILIDFTKELPRIQTVAQIAIYLAIYLGGKRINLLGCDHNWMNHIGESKHFYEESKNVLTTSGYKEWGLKENLEIEIESQKKLWIIYENIRDYANNLGIQIYNLTPGSMLETFPKQSFEDVLRNTP